jgi:hypothetical protein
MQPWDSVLIKGDSQHPDKGRAGIVQAVDNDKQTVNLRLDADATNAVKYSTANFADVQRLG